MTREEWMDKIGRNDSLGITWALKRYGLPKDIEVMACIFHRLSRVHEGDYPVTFDGLCQYVPEMKSRYPEEMLSEYVTQYATNGKYRSNIENATSIPADIKACLLFILPA